MIETAKTSILTHCIKASIYLCYLSAKGFQLIIQLRDSSLRHENKSLVRFMS